ncbi:MAG: hypothetical protein JXP48_13155 [Acidobacteria bacterium]|nr:hypothetical protein [Acidobacteriota bacterium]
MSSRKQTVIARDELRSLSTLAALAQHEESKGEMEKKFAVLDRECVKLAAQLAPFERAGSPDARPIKIRLATRRLERDQIRKAWTFQRERLIAAHRAVTEKYIHHYAYELLETSREIFDKHRKIYIVDRVHGVSDEFDRVRARSNVERIIAITNTIFEYKKQLAGMFMCGLAEINRTVAEARNFISSALETVGDDPGEEVVVSETAFRDARESLQQDAPEYGVRRP